MTTSSVLLGKNKKIEIQRASTLTVNKIANYTTCVTSSYLYTIFYDQRVSNIFVYIHINIYRNVAADR